MTLNPLAAGYAYYLFIMLIMVCEPRLPHHIIYHSLFLVIMSTTKEHGDIFVEDIMLSPWSLLVICMLVYNNYRVSFTN